ncbi:RebB family R body protein [Lysobacter silvisoli]|uniref:RebB like protein n=1 Tax=Lysobacter silvisoli TaxID=2293254 RepID=A0A371JZ92_9GAMM|nr:RebB family R body protein [Lysobacter silvisoli]RDZ26981.1 RebB like protein [Lysobacter silvisoli]
MADNPLVNSPIADAVAAAQVSVTAEAPAQAVASLYQLASHVTGLSLQNAVHGQQTLNPLSTAVVSKAVQLIMAIGG